MSTPSYPSILHIQTSSTHQDQVNCGTSIVVWLVGLPGPMIVPCVHPFSPTIPLATSSPPDVLSVIQIFQSFPWQQNFLLFKTKKPPPLLLFALCFLYVDPGCRGSGPLARRRCLICSILCSLLWGMPSINTTNPPQLSHILPDESLPKTDASAAHSILPSKIQPANTRSKVQSPVEDRLCRNPRDYRAKGKVSVNDIPTNSASCLIGYLNFQCSDQRPEEVQKAFSASTTLIDDDQRPEEVQRTLPASTTPIDDDQRPEEVQKALSASTTLGGSPMCVSHRHPDADSNNEHVQKLKHLNQRASRTHRLHARYYRLFIELE